MFLMLAATNVVRSQTCTHQAYADTIIIQLGVENSARYVTRDE